MKKIVLILISTVITSINAQKGNLNLWGLDYLDEYATVNNFNVEVSEKEYEEDIYEVDRNPIAFGEVKGNINLFRHILPEYQTLEVTDYSFVNFLITNNEPIEIVLMQDEDRAWENRIRYTIPSNTDEKEYAIAFNDFLDGDGNRVEITNIKTIVFSIIGDYTNYKPFNVSVKDLSFSVQSVLAVDDFPTLEKIKLINYPNPFTSTTTIKLPVNSEFIQIQVFDLLGRVVDFKKINTDSSLNKVQYNAPNLKTGIYKYLLKDDKRKLHSGTFIIN